MANPVIDSITVSPSTPLSPGQTATITVTAHDDNPDDIVTVTVTDADGNSGTGQIAIIKNKAITYGATVAGTGTISGGGVNVNTFTYRA